MQVAKENNFTCITTDLQVVYAGAFISKVGHYNRANMDRFAVYQQIYKLRVEMQSMQTKLNVLKDDRDKNGQADLDSFRSLQTHMATMGQLRQAA